MVILATLPGRTSGSPSPPAFTLIIGAAYTLWLVKRVIFGGRGNDHVANLKDIDAREALVLGAFAVGVLARRRVAGAADRT